MDDTRYWDVPADQDVMGHGEYTVTVFLPRFPDHSGGWPAHVAVRARRFAEEFVTIEQALEETPQVEAAERLSVFWVQRTEEHVALMEEVWLNTG